MKTPSGLNQDELFHNVEIRKQTDHFVNHHTHEVRSRNLILEAFEKQRRASIYPIVDKHIEQVFLIVSKAPEECIGRLEEMAGSLDSELSHLSGCLYELKLLYCRLQQAILEFRKDEVTA